MVIKGRQRNAREQTSLAKGGREKRHIRSVDRKKKTQRGGTTKGPSLNEAGRKATKFKWGGEGRVVLLFGEKRATRDRRKRRLRRSAKQLKPKGRLDKGGDGKG